MLIPLIRVDCRFVSDIVLFLQHILWYLPDLPFLMFYRTHVMHLCSDCNRCIRNS